MIMTRALHLPCVALLVCTWLAGTASAGRPKIAVLGLEAAPGLSGAVDPTTTATARELTKELRNRAHSGNPFLPAPNSDKELTDEKLLMSCDSEKADCMAVIGAGLSADKLLFGRVEKKPEGYRVSLKLLDVATKSLETANDDLPAGTPPAVIAKRLYAKLAGEVAAVGTLVIRATARTGDVRSGKVFVDDEPKGELSGGKATVSGVAEGPRRVAIEAPGFRRYEETITLKGGEQLPVYANLLEKAPITKATPTAPAESPSSGWKYAFYAGTAATVLGGGLYAYAYLGKVQPAGDVQQQGSSKIAIGFLGVSNNCGDVANQRAADSTGKIEAACKWYKAELLGGVAAGLGVVLAAVSAYEWYQAANHSTTEHAGLNHPRRTPRLAITPIVTPELGGAQLSVTW
jgi:hypothetical protein